MQEETAKGAVSFCYTRLRYSSDAAKSIFCYPAIEIEMEKLKVVDKPSDILIVDDQPRARQSLKALLRTQQLVQSVEEAAGGLEAIHRIEQTQPVLVIIDVLMRGLDGLETTRRIKARWPEIRIIVLSMYPDYVADALAAGADAFASKGEPPERLLETFSALIAPTKNEHAERNETED